MTGSRNIARRSLRVAAFIYRSLAKCVALVPSRILVTSGHQIGSWVGYLLTRDLEIMAAQLAMAASRSPSLLGSDISTTSTPEQEQAAIQAVSSSCFAHAGESFAELVILRKVVREKSVTHTGDEARFHEMINEGRGVLALSGHLGNFELLAASHAARAVPVTVVGRRPNYSEISASLAKLRNDYGVDTVWRNESGSGRRIVQTLRSGRVLAVLLDQDTNLENCFTPLFGVPAACPVAPVRLAVRMRIPMVTTFIVRTDRLQHRVITKELVYSPDDPEAETKILTIFHERLERLLIQYPSQWVWWHRRWRREPGVDYNADPYQLRGTADYLEWIASLKVHRTAGRVLSGVENSEDAEDSSERIPIEATRHERARQGGAPSHPGRKNSPLRHPSPARWDARAAQRKQS